MKTKAIISGILFFSALWAYGQTHYAIDPAKSEFIWIGKKVTGDHKGKVKISKGEFTVENNTLKAVNFEIDMKTITDEDLTDQEMKLKLEGHLKSPDFFDVEKFPVARLDVKGPIKLEKGYVNIHGKLTIKGVTKPIEFKALFIPREGNYKIFASFSVDRSKFNVKYGSATFFGDIAENIIYDDFQVLLNLSAKKVESSEKK